MEKEINRIDIWKERGRKMSRVRRRTRSRFKGRRRKKI
jgi:hypothetical protein